MSSARAMDYQAFEKAAREVYASVPAEYRAGVDGLDVLRTTVEHPTLPNVYTLGECLSEYYPTEFGGAGVVRSVVVLYYGSFLELSRLDDDWDWDAEIFETITHELQHHLEALADDESLEEIDYAEDQNFARREGESFDPFFYRSGTFLSPGVWSVDGDIFVEAILPTSSAPGATHLVEWGGDVYRAVVPDGTERVAFVRLSDLDEGGELYAVLMRPHGLRAWLARLFRAPMTGRGVSHDPRPSSAEPSS